jgi:hypothetical protein
VRTTLPAIESTTQDARMRSSLIGSTLVAAAGLGGAFALPPSVHAADEVTIYRCTDGQGRLTLRDSPCAKGERQQTRSMLRPKDAPLRAPSPLPPPAPATTTPAPSPQIIVVNAPRPLYECVAPDNSRYLSDTPEGQARWVPLWTRVNPIPQHPPGHSPGQLQVYVDNGRVSGSYISSGHYGGHHGGGFYGHPGSAPTYADIGGGAWVRDPCSALPQTEVCAHLRDRRDALRRRFFNAQPSERATLSREERSIAARLDQDCR